MSHRTAVSPASHWSHHPPSASRPGWATYSVDEDDAVEHWRSLGEVRSSEGHETIVVEVVLRQDREPGEATTSGDGPPEIVTAGIRIRADTARRLADLLIAAADLVDQL